MPCIVILYLPWIRVESRDQGWEWGGTGATTRVSLVDKKCGSAPMLCLCLTSIIEISCGSTPEVGTRQVNVVTLYNLNIRPVRLNKLCRETRLVCRTALPCVGRFIITRQYFSSVSSDDTTGVRNQNSVHFTTLLFKIDENAFLFYSFLMFIDCIYFQNYSSRVLYGERCIKSIFLFLW